MCRVDSVRVLFVCYVLYRSHAFIGLYIMLTTYGAYAVQEFLGKEMYVSRLSPGKY